ncbi:MAG: hypothetical protein HQ569_07720 [Actinobacteria bacterium]|nr:hypothetical protein [Actinomycetota bacterium]
MKDFIDINKLIVNPENYRFDPVENEEKAIDIMIKRKGVEILNLGKHIAEYGLDEAKSIRVLEVNKKFLVLDGNRRITALKCLHSPNIIKDSKIRKCFQELSRKYKNSLLKKVNCYVYPNEYSSSMWIKLEHTGKNNGIGQDQWGAPEKERFDQKFGGKVTLAMQAIDFLRDNNTEINSDKLKISTINRLFSDPNVRDYIGIDQSEGNLRLKASEKEVVDRLKTVFKKVEDENIKVKKVYDKEDRKIFIEELFEDKPKYTNVPISLFSRQEELTDTTKIKVKSSPLSTSRKFLIPSDCIMHISNDRINAIYIELKRRLIVEETCNAVAILFRVFIEFSTDNYIKEFKKEIPIDLNKQPELKKKLEAVSKHLEDKNILTKNQLKPIRVSISSEHNIVSINTFHSYVHNLEHTPDPQTLKITWNNYEIFLKNIWEQIK